MYDPIKNRLRKLTALSIAGILLVSGLAGCKKDETPSDDTQASSGMTETTSQLETTVPATDPSTPTVSADAVKGTVTAEELNVREGVGIKYEVVTKLKQGDVVTILEKQDLNGVAWGRINEGWICLTYVQIEGEPENEKPETPVYEITEPIVGKVIATELNLRSGPGTGYAVKKILKKGDTVTVTELDGNWGKTEDGWINTIFAYFEDTMDTQSIDGVITAEQLNVRSGPSTAYESLRKLSQGDEVTVIKLVTIRDTVWGYIGDGWISMHYFKEK